jgi:heterogeneous nuclear ribonucleoprotein U-like protein 1
MSKLYVTVGVPGSGKSTWIANQSWNDGTVFVSTDQHVEDYAKSVGKTYSQVFKDYMPTAIDLMSRQVIAARKTGVDIVWDQTSTTKAARARKINMLKDWKYEAIAVVFPTPEPEELKRRLASRPGKEIPDSVMKQMINNFSVPTKAEGFNEVIVL